MKQDDMTLNVPNELLGGVPAQGVVVQYTREAWWLDFVCFSPQPKCAQLTARVIMAPASVKRLLETLQKHVERFEGENGYISTNDAGLTVVKQ